MEWNMGKALKSWKIGVVPGPVFLLMAAVIVVAGVFGKLPQDMIGGFSVILVLGILLGDLGNRIPGLNKIGGPAILCLFVPSAMVFYGGPVFKVFADASNTLMKNGPGAENFLYVYISCLIVGSILAMHRKILVQGFIRMFVPLILGSLAASAVGVLVAMAFGYQPLDAYLYILTPIMGGGIGEGIVPTSLGYSQITGQTVSVFTTRYQYSKGAGIPSCR